MMITSAGAGYSTWRDLDVTRWREDGTRDCRGQFCYVRDPGERIVWPVGHQPLGRPADDYEAVFHPWRADFRRGAGDVETRLAVCEEGAPADPRTRPIATTGVSGWSLSPCRAL
jgi:hypothetical protein